MSIPLLVSCGLNDWGPVEMTGENGETFHGVVGLRVFLFMLTTVAMWCLWKYQRITRKMGWLFCGLYFAFFGYAVLGALGFNV